MSDAQPPEGGGSGRDELPQAVVRDGRRRRRISAVWIIPMVAAIIGAGLAWRAYQDRGIDVVIEFDSAAGIKPGKTAIRFRDVDIGTVTDVDVSEDLTKVLVHAQLRLTVRQHLDEGTRFWIVRPRLSAAGVSGLGTLISGDYIAALPPVGDAEGTGKLATRFVGLEEPPADTGAGTLDLVLTAGDAHGVSVGAPIRFRGLTVGEVRRIALGKKGSDVLIYVSILKIHADLVFENTRFRNESGLSVSASLSKGFELDMDSLRTLLSGGIIFDKPAEPGPPAKSGARFELHRPPHHHASGGGGGPPRGPRFVIETPVLGSIKAGEPVLYRGETVGRVVSHALRADGRSIGVSVSIADHYAALVRTNSVFWNASGIEADLGLSGLKIHTESLETLLKGGLAFGTPSKAGGRAAAHSVFLLRDKPPKDWQEWAPALHVGGSGGTPAAAAAAAAEPATQVHHRGDAAGDKKSHHWFGHLHHH